MDRKHLGSHNELFATLWLLKQGYDVFRNVSNHGLIDLVAIRGDEKLLLDVKTSYYRSDGTPTKMRLSDEQIELGVKCLVVFPDGQCILDMDPWSANKTTTSPCTVCGKPMVHKVHKPRRFCSEKCSWKDYSERQQLLVVK